MKCSREAYAGLDFRLGKHFRVFRAYFDPVFVDTIVKPVLEGHLRRMGNWLLKTDSSS